MPAAVMRGALRYAIWLALLCGAAAAASAHEPGEPEPAADSAPVPLGPVEAIYPAAARAAGRSGVVGLELTVAADGSVADVKVTRPAGFGFDEAAVAAVKRMRFRPATHDGRPVAATVAFEQRFVLRPHLVAETRADDVAPAAPVPAAAAPPPVDYESTVVSRAAPLSASASSIAADEVVLRPRTAPTDVLRAVPGLLAVQHQGGGKAEQLFLRGFDADHGTDVALYLDGVPINLPSHAHGQGYADLNWIIPEALARIDVDKGSYDVRRGDFATAGAVDFVTRDRFADSSVQYTLGVFPTRPGRAAATGRFVGIAAPSLPGWAARLHPWVAVEGGYDQGPFIRDEDLRRYSLMSKLSYDVGPHTVVGLFGQAYGSGWIGSGQLPAREVAAGRLSRFGSEDPSEGGLTERQMLTAFLHHAGAANEVDATLFVTRQRLSLWNDFTFFLADPVAGDEIEQVDARVFAGGSLRWHFHRRWRGVSFRTTLGSDARWDGAHPQAFHAESGDGDFRVRLAPYRDVEVDQLDLSAFAEEDVLPTRWLRVVVGLRTDYIGFDVRGDVRGVRQFWLASPKASVIFTPLRPLQLYLDFGMGFHTNQAEVALRDGQTARDAAGNPFTLHAVPRIYTGEVGARAHLFDRLELTAALWASYLENETVFDADAGGFAPSDATRRLGVDLTARARLFSWLGAELALTQADAATAPDAGNGGALALAPRLYLTGGLDARWRWLRGGVAFRWLGDRPAFDETSPEYQRYGVRTRADGTPNPDYDPARVTAQGWFVVDAWVAARWRFLEAEVAAQNLTNSAWREAQLGNSSCTRDEAYNPANANYGACGVTLDPALRVGVADVHFTPGVPINLQFTLKAYF